MKKQDLSIILGDLQKLMVRVESLQKEATAPTDKAMFRGLWNGLAVTHWELREVWRKL